LIGDVGPLVDDRHIGLRDLQPRMVIEPIILDPVIVVRPQTHGGEGAWRAVDILPFAITQVN
jgi:hypothetical protein